MSEQHGWRAVQGERKRRAVYLVETEEEAWNRLAPFEQAEKFRAAGWRMEPVTITPRRVEQPVCKGSLALGSGCGICSRCLEERQELQSRRAAPITAPAAPAAPGAEHPDDAAVDAFAAAMKAKLAKKRSDGRGGWELCTAETLSTMLREHVEKNDPIDVANFCMMLFANGQTIAAPTTPRTEALHGPTIEACIDALSRTAVVEGSLRGPLAIQTIRRVFVERLCALATPPAATAAPGAVTIAATSLFSRPMDCSRPGECSGQMVSISGKMVPACGLAGCKHNHNPTHGGCGTDHFYPTPDNASSRR